MNKFNIIFVLMVLFIKSGLTIKCYSCESSNNEKCHDLPAGHKIEPEVCSIRKMGQDANLLQSIIKLDFFQTSSELDVPMVCQKITAIIDNNKKVTYRGCQLESGNTNPCSVTISKAAERADIKIENCDVCTTDLCNGSNSNNLRIFSPLLIISITFLAIF